MYNLRLKQKQPAFITVTTAASCHSYLRIQSKARMKKSLLSWCSSRRRAHCSNVTDMDVRSLALLQLVNLMPFNLRQIWREARRRQWNTGYVHFCVFPMRYTGRGADVMGESARWPSEHARACPTSPHTVPAIHRISTFFLFLVTTFWLRVSSNSFMSVCVWKQGRPANQS